MPIPSYAPSSIRMHPKFTNSAIIAQRSGQFNFVDVDNTAINHLYHASMPSETAILTRMAISPSGEALALADNEGLLHIWGRGSTESIQFTEYPAPIEWPNTPQDSLPSIDINDPEIPLSEVGMPYYSSELLSSWPTHMTFEVGLPGQRIDEKSLKGMTRQDWYLYGRWNQPGRRRYQVDKSERVEELPRFRSQVEKERALAGEDEELSEKVVGRFEGGEGGVPNYYKKVEIKYSKFGVDDFDFGYLLIFERSLMIDFIIPHRFRGWRHILRIRMRTLCCRCIILRLRYDYTPLLTQRRHVEFHSAHYVNSAFCFTI